MAWSDLVTRLQNIAQQHSKEILTGVGVAGTISTAVLTGRASVKAAELIRLANEELNEAPHRFENESFELELRHKIPLVWKLFIPPVTIGAITITSIIMVNRLAGKEAAALAAAYGLSEKAFSEYRDKVVETIGAKKEEVIHEEVVKEQLKKNPVNDSEVIVTGSGEVLCFDLFSGRYFLSSVEDIRAAENTVNAEIINGMYCSLSRFYEEIGLAPTGFSDIVGFNFDFRCNVRYSTQMSEDGRPCVTIDFDHMPVMNPSKLWG